MRPPVRVLSALVTTILFMAVTAHGQTLLPLLVDASGNFQQVDTEGTPLIDAEMDAAPVDAEAAKEQTSPETQEPTEPEEPAMPPLSPEMATFRDQVRRTLSQVYARSLNAQSNLPTEILAFCEAFGHTAEIASGSRSSQKLNGVGTLCWNYPCGGYSLLRSDGNHVVSRVGYGYQERPAQLLAMLAQNRVPASYELRIGDQRATVADLVASEKLACRKGLDQSATLIGLAFYTKSGETWQNDLGESWSVERLLQEELDRKADASRADVIHRLMAISFALKRLKDKEVKTEGLIERAEKHVLEFHDYALGLQNGDGSWHPGFFAYHGPSKDTTGSLLSTGAILTWLVYSLPSERLEDQRVVLGLSYLNKQLAYLTSRRSAAPSSTLDVIGQMDAARALSLYDVRYFTPRTPKEPVKTDEASGSKESRRSNASAPVASRSTPGRSSSANFTQR